MPPKRKSTDADVPPRRSTRQRTSAAAAATPTASSAPSRPASKKTSTASAGAKKAAASSSSKARAKPTVAQEPAPTVPKSKSAVRGQVPSKQKAVAATTTNGAQAASSDGERQYWLLKAEPESRFENGVDVKFSIDDLAAKTEPEPWDGIRAYAARNNLRAMKKGDLAFFYHSNCKEPGIVGTMEIVQEHSPDLSAHDPKAPYYDASSKPSDPKWSVVHVRFRSKFPVQIGLKELREMGAGAGKPLENMQMLKQSRLSVSRVSAAEWEYLNRVAEEKAAAK